MSLPRIKLTLPPDLRENIGQRVALGDYVNVGQYLRQLIRSDAAEQHRQRLQDRLVARESGRVDTPDGHSC